MTSSLRRSLPLALAVAGLAAPGTAHAKPGFDVDSRALLSSPYATVYIDNAKGDENLSGTMSVKSGSKTLKTNAIDLDWGERSSIGNAVLGKKQLKAIARRGSLPLTVTARVTGEKSGQVQNFRKAIRVYSRGKTTAFDGTWRGTGGLLIRVEGGLIRNLNVSLNLFCPKSNEFQSDSLLALSGFPTVVRRDGRFAAKGRQTPSIVRYEGRFSKSGAAKGYLSMFKTNLIYGDRIDVEQCFQASNWKARRSK